MPAPLSPTPPMVTIFGGSGFLGRYVAQRMARSGWRVRVAVRRPNEALFVKPYGAVGQVEPVQANIRDEASSRRAIEGADAVVNCVGILFETGKQKFDQVQAEGAGRIARLAAECGAKTLVHVSAIGANADSPSGYARSKAGGESAVREAFADATILRPSVIFGAEDQFFNRFAAMARISPVLPLVGAETKFQPVYVDDVAEAVRRAIFAPEARGRTFELGGPRVYSFRELMQAMLVSIRRRRMLLAVPFRVALIKAWFLQLAPNPILTVDQVKLLERDNVVASGASGLAELGAAVTPMESVIDGYLYPYRPYGQYATITAGAEGQG